MMKNNIAAIAMLSLCACESNNVGFGSPFIKGESIVVPYNFPESGACIPSDMPHEFVSRESIDGLNVTFINTQVENNDIFNDDNQIKYPFDNLEHLESGTGNLYIQFVDEEYDRRPLYIQIPYVRCNSTMEIIGNRSWLYTAKISI